MCVVSANALVKLDKTKILIKLDVKNLKYK